MTHLTYEEAFGDIYPAILSQMIAVMKASKESGITGFDRYKMYYHDYATNKNRTAKEREYWRILFKMSADEGAKLDDLACKLLMAETQRAMFISKP